ncbi:hypothetical protein QE369_001195 [Agrobacterium larrymoorei]|uniref:Uncharacterized protein n=1 Tax=Agrobacterium larrymoorei TaxID=160699 RepID=A0AAJ2B9T2_9HYPH|nr:hypothetical protein [Agrobacterium larrymoorei]MDR6101017.1 hypothetical protein [Agrobacterium larrymoorei]
MFFTTSGSTLEIGTARNDWIARLASAADFASEVWTPVAGVNSLGRIAGEWGTEDFIAGNPDNPDDPRIPTSIKTARPLLTMQINAAVLGGDPGQSLMIAAESTVDPFAFRLILPSGQTRSFIALVVAADHIFDEANAVVCWSFSLKPQSNIHRGE